MLNSLNSVRSTSLKICEPLEIEDYVVQTISDVSPIKWHLAHTTWFFEEFILSKYDNNYNRFNPKYPFLFNSYYNDVGDRVAKIDRGFLSRPTVKDILNYRSYVDLKLKEFISSPIYNDNKSELKKLFEIGINHEQQHQELMLYDIKHIFFINPTKPLYFEEKSHIKSISLNKTFTMVKSDLYNIGQDNSTNFTFDNEHPKHNHFLQEYSISNNLVANGEYLDFIESKNYNDPLIWLSDGWDFIQQNNITKPLYWQKRKKIWYEWTFYGWEKLDLNKPVSHVSFYEADAFARSKNCRLPTEQEWEIFAKQNSENTKENFLDLSKLTHNVLFNENAFIIGNLWEWTSSPYSPYPGYKKADGAIGEYNGKFMINQMVLRGGSYGTSKSHFRNTYRNFFQPDKRWLFNGFRLVEN